jgi:tetratricopeptide (TPR) repeat protein
MKNQLDYSEFIERFLDGEMGEQELIWFKKELEQNPALQQEVNLRRKVNLAIADERMMFLKDQLEEAYHSLEKGRETVTPAKARPLVTGAVLLSVFAGAIVLISVFLRNPSNEKIFDKYYKPYESTLIFRSSDMEHSDLKEAMQKYQHGDYKGALVLFEKIVKDDPSKTGLNFYSGISHMEEKNYDDAGQSFNKVIQDRYNIFYEQAEWYLALCYLITDKDEKAAGMFEKIATGNGYYRKQAKKVLNRID